MLTSDAKTKERRTDRIVYLKPVEGKFSLSSGGVTDQRLFTGENKLHVVKDSRNNLWFFKYDAGGLPEPLRQRFSNFDIALDFARKYFLKRNVEITGIED